MKLLYKLLFTFLFIGSFSNTNAQGTACNLTGGSVYVGYTAPPIMMNATVNGMSQYTYVWTNGASANQNQFALARTAKRPHALKAKHENCHNKT